MTALGPGVRVKCVKRGNRLNSHGFPFPSETVGAVYVVESVPTDRGLYLRGIEHFCPCCGRRGAARTERFIPLDGNEDISALEGALKKGPVERDAPARKRELERAK